MDENDLTGDVREPFANGGAFSASSRLQNDLHTRIGGVLHDQISGAITAVAFDDDQFQLQWREIEGKQRVEDLLDGSRLVVHGHDNTQTTPSDHRTST